MSECLAMFPVLCHAFQTDELISDPNRKELDVAMDNESETAAVARPSIVTLAEVAECNCPEACDRDHEQD